MPPKDFDIGHLAFEIRRKVSRLLRRGGLLIEEGLLEFEKLALDEPTLASCYAASIQGRIALGSEAGQFVQRKGRDPKAEIVDFLGPLCARSEGYSLHAAVRIAARDRLERLLRYAARPAIAQDRLSLDERGRVVYEFKTPFRAGSTHAVFEPLTFIEKLAALVPPPRAPLVTYHGALRSRVSRNTRGMGARAAVAGERRLRQ